MKAMIRILTSALLVLIVKSIALGQKIDEQRMARDIEVSENVLSTLLRQQFSKQRMFFPLEVKGNYQPGYGVTFRLPADSTTPMVFSFDNSYDIFTSGSHTTPEPPDTPTSPQVFSYFHKIEDMDEDENEHDEDDEKEQDESDNERNNDRAKESKHEHIVRKQIQREDQREERRQVAIEKRVINIKDKAGKEHIKVKTKKGANLDSVRDVYNIKMIEASKNFLADYSDLIAQVGPTEKIVITNQGEQPRRWVNKFVSSPHRTHLTVEVQKSDVNSYKQGKITRDQLLSKIVVVNTETVETVEPDLELLSSIFNRLYQPDLAKTFFIEDDLYYERLKDYGAVFYMHVYSSNQTDRELFSMPTLKLEGLDQVQRNKKVLELYPEFEKELKDNILEYGRTVKTLSDNEVLVFNVKLTKCQGCGIPSNVEVSVKGSVLKDFGSGKIERNAALAKFSIKKGANQ